VSILAFFNNYVNAAGRNTRDPETIGCTGDFGSFGVSYLQDKEDIEVEHLVSRRISEEALSGKSTSQSTLFEGNSPGKLWVL
jgi:hypothetical protein